MKLNNIEEAILDFKLGKPLIVVDDEDRENEGDFICAAEKITPEMVNFLCTQGRGLICTPIGRDRANQLDLPLMVQDNTSLHTTAFTVSIDSKLCHTGISSYDRYLTIKALTLEETRASDLSRPGHIFPLIAKDGGVLERPGHTEAAIDLCKLSNLKEVGVICEIMNPDGSMARLPELMQISKKLEIKIISIKSLIEYLDKQDKIVELSSTKLPTKYGNFNLAVYKTKKSGEIVTLSCLDRSTKGTIPLVRIHSECITGDVFYSLKCDCGEQLQKSLELIGKAENGIVIYLKQEGRGIGLINKIKAYNLQENGLDTVEANLHLGFKADERSYDDAGKILNHLGINEIKLITNNPEKIKDIEKFNIKIVERVELKIEPNFFNESYLKSKIEKFGHYSILQ